jgi:hypothetical protein
MDRVDNEGEGKRLKMLDIRSGPPQRLEQLTVFPLLSPDAADLEWILLTDALGAGTLRITEVGSGNVPRLLARYSSWTGSS